MVARYWMVILLAFMAAGLAAQQETTFVRYYLTTAGPDYEWEDEYNWWDLTTANVLEGYDNDIIVQAKAMHTTNPPLETVSHASPRIRFDNQGHFLSYVLHDGDCFPGEDVLFSRIVKDDNQGYYAIDKSNWTRLMHLDSNLYFDGYLSLQTPQDGYITTVDIVKVENGFIAAGYLSNGKAVCARYDNELNMQWMHSYDRYNNQSCRLITTSDNGYLFTWSSTSNSYNSLKLNAAGDSLWCRSGRYSEIVEADNKYYGMMYWSVGTGQMHLDVFNLGVDMIYPMADSVYLAIPANGMYEDMCNFPHLGSLRTFDHGIIIYLSTTQGEIMKFNSDFNLQWSVNALDGEISTCGKHPVMEMSNGDIVYCATIETQNGPTFALVRVDSTGQYVGVEDDTQHAPALELTVFPNPFSTTVSIHTEKDAHPASLSIYNLKGQRLKSLPSLSKGNHEIVWDGCDDKGAPVGNGIYFLRLEHNGKAATQKVVRVK